MKGMAGVYRGLICVVFCMIKLCLTLLWGSEVARINFFSEESVHSKLPDVLSDALLDA